MSTALRGTREIAVAVIGCTFVLLFAFLPLAFLPEGAGKFTRSLPVEPIILHRDSPWFGRQAVQTLYLFRGYGFRGGLRWQPQDAHDIRAGRDRTAGARTRVGR